MLEIKKNDSQIDEIIKDDDRVYEDLIKELNERGEDNTYELFINYYKKAYQKDFQEQVKEGLLELEDEMDFASLNKDKEIEKEDMSDEKKFKQSLKEKAYTSYYENVFIQYAILLERALDEENGEGKFSITDKQGTELVLYEKYLQNIDRICKNNNINLDNIDSVKSIKEKAKEDINRKKEAIRYKNNKDIKGINEINQRRNEIAKSLDDISISMNGGNTRDFDSKIKELREEYMKLTYELRTQEPTLEQIEIEAKTEQENQDFATRTYGVNNEIANEYSKGVNVEDRSKDLSGESKDTTNKAMEYKIEQTRNTTIQAEEMLKSAEEAVRNCSFEDVVKYMNIADMYISSEQTSKEQVKSEKTVTTKDDMDKQLDEKEQKNKGEEEASKQIRGIDDKKEEKYDNSIYGQCRDPKNIASDKEQLQAYYLEQIEKRRQQINGVEKENKQAAKETDIDYVRTINRR